MCAAAFCECSRYRRAGVVACRRGDVGAGAVERLRGLLDDLCAAPRVPVHVADPEGGDPGAVQTLGGLARWGRKRRLLVMGPAPRAPRRDDVHALRRMVEP